MMRRLILLIVAFVIPALPAMAIDPTCGMQVDIATARWTVEKDGQTYYFCAPGCRKAFLAA